MLGLRDMVFAARISQGTMEPVLTVKSAFPSGASSCLARNLGRDPIEEPPTRGTTMCILRSAISIGLVFHWATACFAAPPTVYNVRDYGALPDGKTLATQPIQKAIDAASGAGGGTVVCPQGTFRSGTLYLKNNVTLSLEPGATLLGSTDPHDYPEHRPERAVLHRPVRLPEFDCWRGAGARCHRRPWHDRRQRRGVSAGRSTRTGPT